MIISREINNLYKRYGEKKLAHAFLLETNDMDKCLKDILVLVKMLNCQNKYTSNCSEECNICRLIDNGSLPSLIVVNPDGASIKKNQVLELQERFATKPIYSKFNVYIINYCDKLNASSANTMLKFLEEPADDILGFFITDNQENVINTIRSRCQIIKVNYDEIMDNKVDDNFFKLLNSSIKEDYDEWFISRKEYVELIGDRIGLIDNFKNFEEIMVKYNRYLLNLSENSNLYEEGFFRFISQRNVIKSIEIIDKVLSMLKSNVNIDLVLDYFYFEVRDLNA